MPVSTMNGSGTSRSTGNLSPPLPAPIRPLAKGRGEMDDKTSERTNIVRRLRNAAQELAIAFTEASDAKESLSIQRQIVSASVNASKAARRIERIDHDPS